MKKIFATSYYNIESHKFPETFGGCKFILISDLHNQVYGKDNKCIFDKIKQEKPDYIIIAGDMMVRRVTENFKKALAFMKEISKYCPVFYGNGNHEQKLKSLDETRELYYQYIKELESYGIVHLENKTTEIIRNNEKIYITGLELEKEFFSKRKRPKLTKEHLEELIGIKKEGFQILIAHNPMYFKEYAEWGADVVMSGHVHGGIVRLPMLGGVISPELIFFPEYYGGIYSKNGSKMVLSRGLGTHTIKIRVFNKPELVVINLRIETSK